MVRILFDEIEINNDYVVELSKSGQLFTDSFKLGATLCESYKLTIDKRALIENRVPNIIKIYSGTNLLKTLIPDSYNKDDYTITLLLVDNMINANKKYDASPLMAETGSTTLKEILNDICIKMGVGNGVGSFLGENLVVNWYNNEFTARKYLSDIAERNAGFMYISQDNRLILQQFRNEAMDFIDSRDVENYEVGERHRYTRVVYDNGKNHWEFGDTSGDTYYLNTGNVYITTENDVKEIFDVFNGYYFVNMTIENAMLREFYRVGDKIDFFGREDIYTTIIQFPEEVYFRGNEWVGKISLNVNTEKQEETKAVGPEIKIRHLEILVDRANQEIKETIKEVNKNTEKIVEITKNIEGIKTEVSESNKIVTDLTNNKKSVIGSNTMHLTETLESNALDFRVEGNTEVKEIKPKKQAPKILKATRTAKSKPSYNLYNPQPFMTKVKNGVYSDFTFLKEDDDYFYFRLKNKVDSNMQDTEVPRSDFLTLPITTDKLAFNNYNKSFDEMGNDWNLNLGGIWTLATPPTTASFSMIFYNKSKSKRYMLEGNPFPQFPSNLPVTDEDMFLSLRIDYFNGVRADYTDFILLKKVLITTEENMNKPYIPGGNPEPPTPPEPPVPGKSYNLYNPQPFIDAVKSNSIKNFRFDKEDDLFFYFSVKNVDIDLGGNFTPNVYLSNFLTDPHNNNPLWFNSFNNYPSSTDPKEQEENDYNNRYNVPIQFFIEGIWNGNTSLDFYDNYDPMEPIRPLFSFRSPVVPYNKGNSYPSTPMQVKLVLRSNSPYGTFDYTNYRLLKKYMVTTEENKDKPYIPGGEPEPPKPELPPELIISEIKSVNITDIFTESDNLLNIPDTEVIRSKNVVLDNIIPKGQYYFTANVSIEVGLGTTAMVDFIDDTGKMMLRIQRKRASDSNDLIELPGNLKEIRLWSASNPFMGAGKKCKYKKIQLAKYDVPYSLQRQYNLHFIDEIILNKIEENQDRLVKINNEWIIERAVAHQKENKVIEVVDIPENKMIIAKIEETKPTRSSNKGICNIMPYKISTEDIEHCNIGENAIELYIDRRRFKSTTTEEVQKWVNDNKVEILYQMSDTLIEQINKNDSYKLNNIKLVDDYTNFRLNETLITEVFIKYLRNNLLNREYASNDDLKDVSNNVENLNKDFGDLSQKVADNQSEIKQLKTTITQTNENVKVEISQITKQLQEEKENINTDIGNINNKLESGVEKLKNTLVTIDIEGIKVSTNTSAISTLMTNDKFAIKSNSGKDLAFIGYDKDLRKTIARMDNLEITNFLTGGYHRIEKIRNKKRTGHFYVRSDI